MISTNALRIKQIFLSIKSIFSTEPHRNNSHIFAKTSTRKPFPHCFLARCILGFVF